MPAVLRLFHDFAVVRFAGGLRPIVSFIFCYKLPAVRAFSFSMFFT